MIQLAFFCARHSPDLRGFKLYFLQNVTNHLSKETKMYTHKNLIVLVMLPIQLKTLKCWKNTKYYDVLNFCAGKV